MKKHEKIVLKPCCKRFREISVRYQDAVFSDDYQLRMLANLLLCVQEIEGLDVESVREIGHAIDNFINRKIVREHYFFGRSLNSCTLSDTDLHAEIHRIRAIK